LAPLVKISVSRFFCRQKGKICWKPQGKILLTKPKRESNIVGCKDVDWIHMALIVGSYEHFTKSSGSKKDY
jgi:hypothetical protein